MSSLKPIVVYGDLMSPNPAKVRIILEELGLPIDKQIIDFSEVKQEPYISINPNGRLPAIHDPNTGITLWESAAIITYLIDQYDKEHKISYGSFPEKYHLQQWLDFQISGQGPYYGQAIWFNMIHLERLDSAIERYEDEIERVRSVLNTHLAKKAAETNDTSFERVWLVGDKCTYADLSWVMWEHIADYALSWKHKNIGAGGEYPAYDAWIGRLYARPSSSNAINTRAELLQRSPLMEMIKTRMMDWHGIEAPLT